MSWWQEYYADVDTAELDGFKHWFADDVVVQFANWEPVHGRANVEAFFANFLGSIATISHDFDKVLENEDEVFSDCVVNYGLKDGRTISLKAASYARRADGKLAELRAYLDPTELLAA